MEIPINIKLPTSWNGMSERQLREVAYGLEHYYAIPEKIREEPKTIGKLYVHFIKHLIGSNNWIKQYLALKQIPLKEFIPHFQFLLKGNSRTSFPPAFRIKKTLYYPPEEALKNIKIKEFAFADALYYNFKKKKDLRFLDLLIATLYRPKGGNKEMDIRSDFNRLQIEKNVKIFRKLKYKKKLAILYAYEGSRNHIVSLYPTIFPKPKEDEEQKNDPGYTPFGQLIHYKIGFDPGKLEATENLNIHKFLSIYENELKELQKQKLYGTANA